MKGRRTFQGRHSGWRSPPGPREASPQQVQSCYPRSSPSRALESRLRAQSSACRWRHLTPEATLSPKPPGASQGKSGEDTTHRSRGVGAGGRPLRTGTCQGGRWAAGEDSPDRQGRPSRAVRKDPGSGQPTAAPARRVGPVSQCPPPDPSSGGQVPSRLGTGHTLGSWESNRPKWGQTDPWVQEASGGGGPRARWCSHRRRGCPRSRGCRGVRS